MERISFSDGLAIGGGILAIVLVVLDKAGKLRGPMLLTLLAVAATLAIPLCISLPWVADSPPGLMMFSRRALAICLLASTWAGLCAWITTADNTEVPVTATPPNKLIVQSIVLGELRVGNPFTATVYLKNNSGRIIRIKNLAFTQTRPYPLNAAEDMENENAMWSEVVNGIQSLGRDAEFPTLGGGEFSQILETHPVSAPEYVDITRGNHAVYFAMLTRDRDTGENLIELCFFVGSKGIIQFCSTHNRP